MAQVINTNMASLNAQRNLNKSQGDYNQSLQRLSSGLRINSAKDDAAGLAISTRFTSQIKGLNVAVRNAGDGIALAQTAEGALGSMNDNLQRIRELAVQSANATNSDVDREALQAEVEQLVAEISRTASETDFNGRKLLDGSFKATFQIGANAGQTLDINISQLTTDKLGASAKAGVSALGTGKALSNGDLVINGVNIRASTDADDNLSFAEKDTSAIAKVAAINAASSETGVTATVDENVVIGQQVTGTAAAGAKIELNGVVIDIQGTSNTTEIDKAGTRNSVVAAINAKSGQTGVIAEDGGASGGVVLKAADGRNISLKSNTANVDWDAFGLAEGAATTATAVTFQAGFTLTAANANTPINIQGGDGTGGGDIANSGLQAGNYTAQTAYTSGTSGTVSFVTGGDAAAAAKSATDRALQAGDLVINGVSIRASTALDDTSSYTNVVSTGTPPAPTTGTSEGAASGIAIAAAINSAYEATGVKATVNATEFVGTTATAANVGTAGAAAEALKLKINNVEINAANTGDLQKNKAAAISAINEVSGQTGVTAVDNGVSITLQAADGRNITFEAAAANAAHLDKYGLGGTVDATDGGAATVYSSVTLSSTSAFEVEVGTNGNKGLTDSGLKAGTFGGGQDGQALSQIDISTFEGAQKALVAVDNAIGQIASQRADLGAIQNRMESTVSNLEVTAENLNAANSRIMDADFAAETAEMSRSQVLQQAGISVLAQANASTQNVLSLLG